MSFEAYLLLTDMHLNTYKDNRFHYNEECIAVIERIADIASSLRDRGATEVHGISLGDLCDVSKKSRSDYVALQQQLKLLLKCFDNFYLNFGNHEITYYRDNPVYSFIHKIEHPHIASMYRQLHCESAFDEIKTPERLIFNNAEIVFRGWGTRVLPKTEHRCLMLLHEPLLSPSGISELYATNSFEETPYELDCFTVSDIYCGHVHTVVETWDLAGTRVHNLGSLLRSSVSEISDGNRTRYVPVLIFDKNRNLIDIETHSIVLHERALIVDEEAYARTQEVREDRKERKQLKAMASLPNLTVDDPIQKTREILESRGDTLAISIFEDLAAGQIPLWENYNNHTGGDI